MAASEDDYEYSTDEDGYSVEGDGDDMDWNEENPNAAPTQFKSVATTAGYKSGIRILKAVDLRPVMQRRIGDVTDILKVSSAAAAVLLRQYNYSKEQLLEQYMQNADKILKKAGVYHRCGHAVESKTKRTDCAICYDDECDLMMAMSCGHSFCMECWYDFCDNAVNEGPVSVRTTCPQAQCNEIVTEEEMGRALGSNAPQMQKFLSFQLRSFVEANNLTRWCPGKGCERIACAESASAMEAEGNLASCDACLTSFCLVCGEEPHAPSSCKDLARWNEKCRNESETANWILANTKSCPRCRSRIEKNQGCNHMTCSSCKYEFCWICMGDWTEHGASTGGYYKCNKFDSGISSTSVPDGDQSDAAKAKRDLDRYLHFYKRFHAHQEAQHFAQKQLLETENRMVLLQESCDGAKWTDVEFLKTANEQLVECRRVLKFTYVFAFYMDPAPAAAMQRERFEHHQEMLERFTEHLSELSEKALPEMDRTDVVNQTRVVDRFMKNILKYVDDGMEDI
mmetsp:Transcript_12300/g.16108  ORF Transcript_12300/g.16108 Transcript_12300/m.16108 type:complete len:510 (+) Transcript_12300:267-1796(+)|eukprot:CAMPEP_0198138850 /NCGR_PEP_ID=MMETSP1443-20131203/2229_1 /TAXON_ID=186043 /ORGANISM="Entomoneis sp., Strain CCMP2396" /LENGTH=509 /DNA_ID=CAMNT_0043800791 /DNA_START=200 /DNA_END=1729 /DNA_ORIENTATION=-